MKVKFSYINKKIWILVICMIILALVSMPSLPNEIACKWNSDGVVVNTINKFILFIFPLIGIAIILLGNIVATVDPKPLAYKNAKREYNLICSIVIISLLLIECYIIMYSNGMIPETSKFNLLTVIPGVVLMVAGNYLPKFSQNYLTGVKTVWAYNDKDIWRKTQRFSSKIWIVCGFLIAINGALLQIKIREVNIVLILIMLVSPRIYGFIKHYKTIK